MLTVPTNIEDNKKIRLKVLQKAENNPELQAILIRKCKEDPIFFCNLFCWTYDPRLNEPHLPFILYPRQAELFKKLEECYIKSKTITKRYPTGENKRLILDKPRDVGATFTVSMWALQKFLFSEADILVGSRKEDIVDKTGSTSSLFYKFDYNLKRFPQWLANEYDKRIHRTKLLIKHPRGNNAIEGESSNMDFGRGGRYTIIIFDEIGFWESAESSWSSAGESSRFKIAMSTPPETGRDSFFYKLTVGQKGNIDKFDFDWYDVPSRDENWLEDQRKNKSEEEFAREVMKSFDGSTKGKVYAKDMKFVKMSDVEYDPSQPLFCAWDFGLDAVAMIWYQKDFSTRKLKIIDCYQNSNQDISFFMPFLGYPIESTYEYNSYDLKVIERHSNWRRDMIHCGDPSVKQRHLSTGESVRDLLQNKYHIYIESKDWAGRKWTDLRDITRQTFRRMEMNEKRCEMLIYSLRNARYPKKKEGSQAINEPLKPIHDGTSHLRSAWEYACDNEPENYFMEDKEEVEEAFNKFDIF